MRSKILKDPFDGFKMVNGKYSHMYNTRGLILECEESSCRISMAKEPTDSSTNVLRYNEYGEIVMPPVKPQKPDTSKWKRMTDKRRETLRQYKVDKEQYEVDMAKWLQLPTNEMSKVESLTEFYRSRGKLLRDDGGIVLFDVSSKDTELEERIKADRLFFDELRKKAEEAKRKEGVQITLDGIVRFAPPVRRVDLSIIKSFGEKPNVYLEKAWLESIWYGKPLTDWQSYQIDRRAKGFVGSW